MNVRNKTILFTEIALVVFIWMVLLITPILFREDNNNPLWKSVANQLEILIPLSILFFINRFILVPRFLFKGKIKIYIFSLLGVILFLTLGSYFYDVNKVNSPKPRGEQADRPMRQAKDSRPNRDSPERNPPERNQPDRNPPTGDRPSKQRQPRPVPPFANFLIFSFLVVGFDTGLRSGLRWIGVENEKVRLEKENVSNQLALLKTQVSPHFFMNTLNNIHALVDTNTDEAKEAIIKLSKMMRYLLYETETEKTTLKKEVEFLESYINLMKLRFSAKVKIIFNLPGAIPDAAIPPFLFISFIENAFKHGISYKNESFIAIDLILGKDRLLFAVRNSRADNSQSKEFSGIGIENTRKRLDLLYGVEYHLEIIENEELFTVNLSIPL
ncbi:MAG: histidine kinase [Bacteroidota bacterium]